MQDVLYAKQRDPFVKNVSWSTVKKWKKKYEATRGQKSFRRPSVL